MAYFEKFKNYIEENKDKIEQFSLSDISEDLWGEVEGRTDLASAEFTAFIISLAYLKNDFSSFIFFRYSDGAIALQVKGKSRNRAILYLGRIASLNGDEIVLVLKNRFIQNLEKHAPREVILKAFNRIPIITD